MEKCLGVYSHAYSHAIVFRNTFLLFANGIGVNSIHSVFYFGLLYGSLTGFKADALLTIFVCVIRKIRHFYKKFDSLYLLIKIIAFKVCRISKTVRFGM